MSCDPAVTVTHRDVKYRKVLAQAGMNELLWDRLNLRCFTFNTRVELPRRHVGVIGVKQGEKIQAEDSDWHCLQAGGKLLGLSAAPWGRLG